MLPASQSTAAPHLCPWRMDAPQGRPGESGPWGWLPPGTRVGDIAGRVRGHTSEQPYTFHVHPRPRGPAPPTLLPKEAPHPHVGILTLSSCHLPPTVEG